MTIVAENCVSSSCTINGECLVFELEAKRVPLKTSQLWHGKRESKKRVLRKRARQRVFCTEIAATPQN